MRDLSRRRFLVHAGAAAAAVALLPARARAALPETRSVAFEHLHTGERLNVTYAEQGRYLPDAMDEIEHLLRDFRSGERHAVDPALLDTLDALSRRLDNRRPYQVISGYRSPATNRMLQGQSSGVATRSLHLEGRAVDVRLTGTDTAALRRAAVRMERGGVGYYPSSDFVHLDTGRVRSW